MGKLMDFFNESKADSKLNEAMSQDVLTASQLLDTTALLGKRDAEMKEMLQPLLSKYRTTRDYSVIIDRLINNLYSTFRSIVLGSDRVFDKWLMTSFYADDIVGTPIYSPVQVISTYQEIMLQVDLTNQKMKNAVLRYHAQLAQFANMLSDENLSLGGIVDEKARALLKIQVDRLASIDLDAVAHIFLEARDLINAKNAEDTNNNIERFKKELEGESPGGQLVEATLLGVRVVSIESFKRALQFMIAVWKYHQGCNYLAAQCNELNPVEEDTDMKVILVTITKRFCGMEGEFLGRGIFDEIFGILENLSADVSTPYNVVNNICARHINALESLIISLYYPKDPIYKGKLKKVPLHIMSPKKVAPKWQEAIDTALQKVD